MPGAGGTLGPRGFPAFLARRCGVIWAIGFAVGFAAWIVFARVTVEGANRAIHAVVTV